MTRRRISLADVNPALLPDVRARYAAAVQASDAAPADYRARAELHRPADPGAIAAEVRRMAASGLTAADVASALRLPLGDVLEALQGVR